MKKENLIKFIEKELSYDAAGGEDCPHCHKNIKPHRNWIDHKSALARNVNKFFGFKKGSYDDNKTEGTIFTTIEEFYEVTGKRKEDAEELGLRIWQLFYD